MVECIKIVCLQTLPKYLIQVFNTDGMQFSQGFKDS